MDQALPNHLCQRSADRRRHQRTRQILRICAELCSDDHLVTNAALLTPNYIGTISAAHENFNAAHAADWDTIISARSGESEDI